MADVPVLKLNVGGTPVHVRRSTLENSGVPALAALCNFEDRFIDRPLVPFEFVLDWVRTMGQMALPSSLNAVRHVSQEAEYWQVDGLVGALKLRETRMMELAGVSPVFHVSRVEDREQASEWVRERAGFLRVRAVPAGDGEVFFVSDVKV